MNNNVDPNQMQDMNVGGQPVELGTPDNMVNMDQVMGANSAPIQDIQDPSGNQKLKKAAIYLFVIGALLVVMGIVYSVLGIGSGEETTETTNNNATTEEVTDAPQDNTATTDEAVKSNTNVTEEGTDAVEQRMDSKKKANLICKLNNSSKSNGIDQTLTYEFYNTNGKLTSYTKTYEVVPINGHSDGIITVNKEIAKYDTLKSKIGNLSGYVMSVSSVNDGITETLTVKVNVDLNSFKNNLSGELKKNKVTNVEYKSGSNTSTIKKDLIVSGYSCS